MSGRERRAFVSATPQPGSRVSLDAEESHHVARVLRLSPGDPLSVFDGKGGEWSATIERASPGRVTVVVGEAHADEVEPKLRVVLCQSLARPEKIEWVLQKGTELGVAGFRLCVASRAEAPPPSPDRLNRYERIVMEACKQSGRRVLPAVRFGAIDAPGRDVLAILLSPGAGVAPLGAILADPVPPEVWIAVGPEGGFSDDELARMGSQGWRLASLGPRILRTETAGAIAAAIVLHTWGDLGPRLGRS